MPVLAVKIRHGESKRKFVSGVGDQRDSDGEENYEHYSQRWYRLILLYSDGYVVMKSAGYILKSNYA